MDQMNFFINLKPSLDPLSGETSTLSRYVYQHFSIPDLSVEKCLRRVIGIPVFSYSVVLLKF